MLVKAKHTLVKTLINWKAITMGYWDLGYFDSKVVRKSQDRTIASRVRAWKLGEDYYDGNREDGYGGFSYDGRWKALAPKIIERYNLTKESHILDVGAKKGFFIHDMKECLPGATVRGVESHTYPVETGLESVRSDITFSPYTKLPFHDSSFDFVLAFSSIYMLNLGDVIHALQEIERVGSGKSFITVAAYNTSEERELFLNWTLIGTTVLHVDEWKELFHIVGYSGDYFFTSPASLNLS